MAPNAPLVGFRIAFGLLMAAECFGAIATGWVAETFVEPRFTFPLRGFEALRVLSGPGMFGYFAAMGSLALGVALGWRYRACAAGLALLWTGAYLAQKSHYNNHYYLAVLIAWAMVFLPAHRARSLDVAAGRVEPRSWCSPWIARGFRLQLGIVFGFAALAKLYPGWWEGDFLRVRLAGEGDTPLVGGLLQREDFRQLLARGGIGFDALVIPALCWRPTRWLALGGLVLFNAFNALVFEIGIFPLLVLALALFCFEDLFPAAPPQAPEPGLRPGLAGLLVALFLVQLALPVRHLAIPGDVNWTEEGHRMAWRMMLRTKAGGISLEVRDPDTGEAWPLAMEEYVTPGQRRHVATKPEFLFQLARIVEREERGRGRRDVGLFVRGSAVSLNGGPTAALYARDVDLTEVGWNWWGRDDWVLDAPPR